MRSPCAPPAPGPAAFGEIRARIAELRGNTSNGDYFPKVRNILPIMIFFANCLALADQLAQGRHRVFERKSAGLLIKRAVTIGNFYTAFRNFELRLQFVLGAKKGGNIWPSTRPAPPHRSSRSDQRIAHSPLTGPPDRLVCKYRRISAYAPSMLRFLEALPGRSAALSVWVLLLLSADPVLCRSSRLLWVYPASRANLCVAVRLGGQSKLTSYSVV